MHASARWTVTALLAIAAVLCVLALAGCGGSTSTPTTGSIAGVATWSDATGAAHVRLRFTGASVTYLADTADGLLADGGGAYSVSTPMLPGSYAVYSWTLPATDPVTPGTGRPVIPATITITAGQTLSRALSIEMPPPVGG